TATITYTLSRSPSPTPEESTAYTKITSAIEAAIARHARVHDLTKALRVNYRPGVPTAEASYNGDVNFGSNTGFMTERTALHEIAHTLGVGQTQYFDQLCAAGTWPKALALLKEWDGADARISCGGGHFWPYGLNYDTEWSETNADRHVRILGAMIEDGL
ncbi:hypothetical protein BDZ85DRAFT_175969, partial [Elsinoe ampelina]